MRILVVTSEAVPFAKTGGLADVCGALPKALSALGHQVRLVMPRYRKVDRAALEQGPYPLGVPTGLGERWCLPLSTKLPDSDLSFHFLEHDALFDRPGLYGPPGGEGYPDNCLRFTVLCRGALQLCHHLRWYPEVIHCHDWQAALIPWLLFAFEAEGPLAETATVLTIHNLAYQGRFSAGELVVTGLGWEHFDWRGLEFHGGLNLLKGGIARATLLSTVSPSYAREIQTPAFGEELADMLSFRAADLRGLLNGIDDKTWNPETDLHLPTPYGVATFAEGKAGCARALRDRLGLPQASSRPLLGFIGRLVKQKGVDLILEAAERLVGLGAQLVILGTGDPEQERQLRALAARQEHVAAATAFDEGLSHLVQGACDLLLMPSRYEPCGLNQLYAMRYGTLPVVTGVGGLRDSVVDAAQGDGRGFVLEAATVEALVSGVARALRLLAEEPERAAAMIRRAMSQRLGWDQVAGRYVELYEEALSRTCR